MGTSLYDDYLRQKDAGGDSLYDEYLAEQRKKKPSLLDRARAAIAGIGSDDEVSDPTTGQTFKRSQTPSSSRPPNDQPGDIDLDSVSPKQKPSFVDRLKEATIDSEQTPFGEEGMPPRGEPGEFGKGLLRGTGQLASVVGSATKTATRGRFGDTPRKLGRAIEEAAGPPRIKRAGDIRGPGDALAYGARVAGETLPWVGADVAAGAAAGPLGVYGSQGIIVEGMIREELESQGVTDEPTIQKVTALIGVPAAAAGAALPAMVLRNILGNAVKKKVVELGIGGAAKLAAKEVAKHAATGALGLATQQVAIKAGTQLATGQPIDPAELYETAASSAELGATAGGLMGAVGVPGNIGRQRAVNAEAAAAPKLHPETPPEVAQKIAQSANAKIMEPEKIIAAATQVNGKTYTGVIHADAVRAAIDAGDLPPELLNGGPMDATHLDHGAIDGFVTNKGRFVNRGEAEQIADAADQIRPDRVVDPTLTGELAPGLDALDLKANEVNPPKVGEMRTMDILADPSRFQFKAGKDEKTGAGGALKKVDLYREDLAGIMTVWRDPADGKVYVVNGHHRLDLAKRSGQPTVLVRFITAPSAEAARAQGAIQNIAEGQGAPTDVAKFLRDTRQTLEDLKAQGVPVEASLASKGIGLSRLADDLFQKIATGKIDEATGVGIGNVTADADMQRTAAAVIQKSGKRLTEKEAADVTRQIVAEGTENVSQETLFGTEQERVPLYVEKAQLAGAIQRRLETDKRLFSYITKGSRADELARAGNVINKEKSAEIAEQSAQLGEVFRQLFTRKGAVSDALTEGARRLVNGEKPAQVADSIYEGIRAEIQAAFGGGKGADVSGDARTPEGHEGAGRAPATESATDAESERVRVEDSTDPSQDALFSPSDWDALIAKQRQRLYDKLNRARGKDERSAVIRELRELDKVKNKNPENAIDADEMARRARQGETRQAVESITGEEAQPTSRDRAQSEMFEQRRELTVDMLRHEEDLPEQGGFLSPAERADDVERILKPAITIDGGEPIDGYTHPDAITRAVEMGKLPPDVWDHAENYKLAEGFTTTHGRFVSREEAYDIADQADQLEEGAHSWEYRKKVDEPSLDSLDLKEDSFKAAPKSDAQLPDYSGELDETGVRGKKVARSERHPITDADLEGGELKGYEAPATPAVNSIRRKVGLPALPRPQRALIEISRDLADAAGVPLRQGRFNAAMRQAAGVFFPHAETTRVIRYDKVDTVAHEVGHFVSKRHLKNPANKGAGARGAMQLTKEMLGELRAMGHNLYGSRKPAAGYGEEGIAEAFKFYVTDPARLQTEAPKFLAALEAELDKQPMLKRALLQARADFDAHQQSDATSRADALLSVDETVRNMPSVDEIVRQAVDDLHPFRKAVESIGGTDDITKHAYVLSRLTRGDAGLAEEMNERGVIDFHTRKRITDGVIPVLQSIPREKMQAFRRYLYAERAIELHERKIDVGLTMKDASKLKQLYEGEFKKPAEKLWAHSNALLKYRRDAGLLTDAEYKAIAARNQRRAPMYVVFDEGRDNTSGGGWGKKWGRNTSGINTIKGSARRKIDPLEGYIQDTYQTVEQVNRHHTAATLFKLGLETEGGGRAIEEVAKPQVKTSVMLPRVMDQLMDLGLVDTDRVLQSSTGELAIEDAHGNIVPLDGIVLSQWDFRKSQNAGDAKDMVIPTVIDGERHWLQIQDPKLFEALNALGHERLPQWARFFGAPARALRAGATLTPEFLGRNPFRDIFTAASYTRSTNKADAVPGVLFARGLFHLLQKDETFQRWRLEGGDNAAQLAVDRKELQRHIEHVTRNFHEIARDLVIHPIDTLRLVSAAMENATRLGEFTAVEQSRLKAGQTPRQAAVAAAIASRDITIDFGRHGAAAKSINQIVAFFNANLQGTDKIVQELRRRPGTVALRAIAGITIPSIVLYAMQHDDADYRKLPRWRKSLFWNWVQRDDQGNLQHIWSFPKPFELGIIFGTLPEAMMEWWLEHDADGFKEWARAAAAGFTPGTMPTAFLPLIENWANKNFFTGRKVVPSAAERRQPGQQTRESTGEFARQLGERIHYSPAKIENLIREWWGGLGMGYAMPIANSITRADRKLKGQEPYKRSNPAAEDPLTQVPGVKGFMSYPPTGTETQQVEDLYDAFQKADAVRQSYKALKDAGRDEDAHQFAIEHREELSGVRTSDSDRGPGRLRMAYNRLEEARQQRAEILRDDKLTGTEKKRRVRILDDRMVKIAERGLAAVKN